MSKLRTIAERKNGPAPANDLRGLNDAEIFSNSGLFVHTLIQTQLSEEEVRSCVSHYDLNVSAQTDGLMLHSENVSPGSHKLQAVRHFVACLELLKMDTNMKLVIFQINGLAQMLSSKMAGHQAEDELHDFEQHLKNSHEHVSIHAPIAHYLTQAGYVIEHHNSINEISDSTLSKIQTEISKTQTSTQQQSPVAALELFRKVG